MQDRWAVRRGGLDQRVARGGTVGVGGTQPGHITLSFYSGRYSPAYRPIEQEQEQEQEQAKNQQLRQQRPFLPLTQGTMCFQHTFVEGGQKGWVGRAGRTG